MTESAVADPQVAAGTVFRVEARKYLLQALFDKAANVVPSKDIMPVLRNFQVEAAPGRLRVAATDMELSVIATTEMVKVEQSGTIFLPASKMQAIVSSATGDDMLISAAEGIATIRCGRATWTLKLEDGHEFPALPEITDVSLYDIDRGLFMGGLQSVRYAASTDLARANLAMIDVTDGVMTASDGARFQQARLGDDFPLSLQIPISAVDDLVKLLRTTDLTRISVGESENHIVFRVGENVFIANKLMVTFPNVEAQLLAPTKGNTDELHVDREELLEVIKRVRINADSETSAILLRLSPDAIEVASRDKYGNASEEALSAGWKAGERTLVVNHKFLTQMLTGYDGKTCHFMLGEGKTRTKPAPVLLRDEQTGALGVIQQMRQDWIMDS